MNHLFLALAAVTASLYLVALVYSAWRSHLQRELYVLKAVIVAYLVYLALAVLAGTVTRPVIMLYRPSLAALFFLLFLGELIQARRRR